MDSRPKRRDILACAGAATVWPLLAPGPVAGQTTVTIDTADLSPGAELQVYVQGWPYQLRHRTPEDIAAARATPLADLPDPEGRNGNRPGADASDTNRTIPPFDGEDSGEWLLVEAVCPHLGCVPLGGGAGDYGGWFCPCHGAHFDTAGRVRSGPARSNLAIPRAEFTDATTVTIKDRGAYSVRPL